MGLLNDPQFRKRSVPGLVGILLGVTFIVAVLFIAGFPPSGVFWIVSLSIIIALGAVWYWGLWYQRHGWPQLGPPVSQIQRGGEIVCGVGNVACVFLAIYLIGAGRMAVALGLLTVGSILGISLLILLKRRQGSSGQG